MKVKDRKALIHLQGMKTREGSYFRVYNLDNRRRGLLKIDRVSHTKAIGTLKVGAMSQKWNLEPVSKRTALFELKSASERKERLALIQKEKMKRRVAQKKAMERRRFLARQKALEHKRRQLAEKRRLAHKKKNLARKVASFSLREDVLEGLDEYSDDMGQSDEVLSYNHPEPEPEVKTVDGDYSYPKIESQRLRRYKKRAEYFDLGLRLTPEYNFMTLKPRSSPSYSIQGVGGSIHLHALASRDSLIEFGGLVGYRYFNASTSWEEDGCPRDEGCTLLVHYFSAMSHFKFNVLKFKQHVFWVSGEGSLMLPLLYLSRIPDLKSDHFEGISLHGTVGVALGFDFKLGDIVLPVGISGSLHMPWSQTTLLLAGALQTGLRYRF